MNFTPIKVLLIEDNPGDARLLQETLAERTGEFQLHHVERLSDGLRLLAVESFDVILSDLGLPDSHGVETFERLHGHAPQVPIIVLSGLWDEELMINTVHNGAQDYLVKGHVPRELLVRAVRYAIERKSVQEELRRRNAQLETDLDLAREFQLAFLPRKYPSFPTGSGPERSALRFCHRYQPSGAVGGDFFDILPLAPMQAGIFICDVMGHGVRAALVTAILRGLMQESRSLARDPGQFLTAVNSKLAEVLQATDTTMFATAAYVVLDLTVGEMWYAGAGHPSPLHVRRAAGTVAPVEFAAGSLGSALGMFQEARYMTSSAPLALHDLILLYTDGLFEVRGTGDELYGTERLLAHIRQRLALPGEALCDGLVAEVQRFSGSHEFLDDVCLVGVEVARLGLP